MIRALAAIGCIALIAVMIVTVFNSQKRERCDPDNLQEVSYQPDENGFITIPACSSVSIPVTIERNVQ